MVMTFADATKATGATAGTASTLRLNLAEIIERVSHYLGMGLSPSGDNLELVLNIMNDGYTNFLFPQQIPDRRGGLEPDAHEWSFMSPTATLSLLVDQWEYDLPLDFGGLRDTFTYPVNTPSTPVISVVSEGYIRAVRTANDTDGDPCYVAIRVKSNTETSGTRHEAIFYPTPDTERTLTYRYTRTHSKLDDSIASGTAAITGSGSSFTTLTDAAGDFSSVIAGDLISISQSSGPREGLYTVASTDASTEITLATTAAAAGTCTYRVFRGTVLLPCPVWCHQAVLESMLDVAARRHDDEVSGAHTEQYLRALGAAVRRDRLLFRERTKGYQGNSGVGATFIRRAITRSYNGVEIT